MQLSTSPEDSHESTEPEKQEPCEEKAKNSDEESVIDISGRSIELFLAENLIKEEGVEGLYLYKNVFNLVPRSVGSLGKLRRLKFFGNEINLLPAELGNLVGLECLQIKLAPPRLNVLGLNKLKELELSKVPPRPSVLRILSEIAGLSCLTKLSVCHFSIRYLPLEIGCLNSLEYLDLSFNKIKSLPTEISFLTALKSLKVANNKLVEIPSSLSSLLRLESLDLSNNRLTSLGSLDLGLMYNLQILNLQYNKLRSCCQIPTWICCNLEGNGKDTSNDDFISSSVEMDVYETISQNNDTNFSCNVCQHSSSSMSTGPSSNSRCFSTRRSSKRWKRRHYLQQKARQERLNSSRKWKGEAHTELLGGNDKTGNTDLSTPDTSAQVESDIIGEDDDNKQLISGETEGENVLVSVENNKLSSERQVCSNKGSPTSLKSISEAHKEVCHDNDASSDCIQHGVGQQDEGSSSEISRNNSKSKRHSDGVLDNPKPCKSRKQPDDCASLSHKYSSTSFCGAEEHIPDGFYDAGRDRPFMPLSSYQQILHLDSREVILVDRQNDEVLDAIVLSAQAFVLHLKSFNGLAKNRDHVTVDNLRIASLLALFVSDHFGGGDRNALVERTRKAVSGSNYQKSFVCTCSTGNCDNASTNLNLDTTEDIIFSNLCEKALHSIKTRLNSAVVPIGTLQFGVCRHRALLLKYLCDRMEPPIPCELVRGYLDFSPHAWNVVLIQRGDKWIRMVVDACRPHDIREETDPEFFTRFVPLSRCKPDGIGSSPIPGSSFPSLSTCDEFERVSSSSLLRCKFQSVDAAIKVRTLEACGSFAENIKNFEYSCLGEVRILGALRHPCIVQMYGHQISCKWVSSADGNPERRVLQSAILMEYVRGGSLKNYVEKLAETGEKRVPLQLALSIARDVASALSELHSRHIIHRDIKSENILIDLDTETVDGSPLVKLCDFDRAIPLRSFLHKCCIGHLGVHPPDVCVGTPLWMAPEVLRAMHKCNRYGLEVDIWSYGCLLYELLTLQIPYSGLSETQIHDLLQMGKRPPLTDELNALGSSVNEPEMAQPGAELEEGSAADELESLRFLIDLYRRCTEESPSDRPTARELHEMLLERTSNITKEKAGLALTDNLSRIPNFGNPLGCYSTI